MANQTAWNEDNPQIFTIASPSDLFVLNGKPPASFLMREVSIEVKTEDYNGSWTGSITLLCFSPIVHNGVLQMAIERELRGELGDRAIGISPFVLKTLSIRRYLTAEEKALYNIDAEAESGLCAVVVVGYWAGRANTNSSGDQRQASGR